MSPFAFPVWVWQPALLIGVAVGAAIIFRVRRGKRLFAYGEKPPWRATGMFLAACVLYSGGSWGFEGWTAALLQTIGLAAFIAAQFMLFSREGLSEAFVLREKGLSFRDVPRWRYVPWGDFDRFAWEEDSLVLYYRGESIRPRGERHPLAVPADKRSEVESIIAIRVEAARR
jgi:hypothetical protein